VTVSVTVQPVNDAPEATPDALTGEVNSEIMGQVSATDPDGDLVTFGKASDPTSGTVTVAEDGSYTYTPAEDFVGLDGFDVLASDGNGGEDLVTVAVQVTAPNAPPVAAAEPVEGDEDTNIAGQVTATDADEDLITFSKATEAANGTVVVEADGRYIYTPNANYHGSDGFDVLAEDSNGGSDQVSVAITVNSVNDVPVAVAAVASVDENGETSGQLMASDADNDPLSFTLSGAPENGEVTVDLDGQWQYTPDADVTGSDSFDFEVSDGNGGSDTATVAIEIRDTSAAAYETITGSSGRDLLDGADDSDDALFGGAGNDRLDGGGGNDLLFGGPGDDKLFGGDDDDIFVFEGSGTDRAKGDAGADTFVLTAALLGDGQADKVKIVDYQSGLDVIDLGGAEITDVTELSKRLLIEVGTEGDTLEFLNLTDINLITFVSDSPIA